MHRFTSSRVEIATGIALSHPGVWSWTTLHFLNFQHVSALSFLGFRHCGANLTLTWESWAKMDGSSTPPHHTIQSYLVAAGSWMIGWYCTLHQLTKKKTNSFARKSYLQILCFPNWFTAAYSSLFFPAAEDLRAISVNARVLVSQLHHLFNIDSRPAQCAAARNGMILLGWPAIVYLCCWVANSAIGIEKATGLAAPLLKITLIQVHFYFKCPSWSWTGDIIQYMKSTYSTV